MLPSALPRLLPPPRPPLRNRRAPPPLRYKIHRQNHIKIPNWQNTLR
uniref:Uncharacterized protein n=1 Tax=Rhizophora mucronata TaxID=61149 RepID=A0A2P2NZW6_RHIMU